MANGEADILECTPSSDGLLITEDDGAIDRTRDVFFEYGMECFGTPVDLPWGDGFMSYASFRMMGSIE